MSDKAGDDDKFTRAAECASLTAEDGRLGRMSTTSTVESSRRSMNEAARVGFSHNAPSPLGRNSRNPGNSPLSVRCRYCRQTPCCWQRMP